MELLLILLVISAAFVLLILLFKFKKPKIAKLEILPQKDKHLLATHVEFYKQLNKKDKAFFESRVQRFLSRVRITGIKTPVEDLDKILIAASAIIPIFKFLVHEYKIRRNDCN